MRLSILETKRNSLCSLVWPGKKNRTSWKDGKKKLARREAVVGRPHQAPKQQQKETRQTCSQKGLDAHTIQQREAQGLVIEVINQLSYLGGTTLHDCIWLQWSAERDLASWHFSATDGQGAANQPGSTLGSMVVKGCGAMAASFSLRVPALKRVDLPGDPGKSHM